MFCKFCGKELNDDAKFCKYCGGNLNGSETNTHTQTQQVTTPTYTPVQEPKKPFNPWGWIIAGVVLLIIIGVVSDDDASSSGSGNTYTPPPTREIDTSAFDISLANGTVLKKSDYYLSGDGDLEIDNGTQYDAVAKLIRGNTAIYSVYIKANSVYTITGISDGNYELIFAQGSDWNSTTKSFNKNQSYETFEDTFDFETTSSQSTIWKVSLKERVGGNAETNIISPSEFNKY